MIIRSHLSVLSIKSLLILFFLCLSLTIGCSSQNQTSFKSEEYGFRFDFPKGWTHLSKQELKDMQFGFDHLLVLGDQSRKGIVLALPMDMARGDVHLNTMVKSITKAIPNRYKDVKVLKSTVSSVQGRSVGEIIFSGNRLPDQRRWRRLFVVMNPSSKKNVLIFGMSCPVNEKANYDQAFQFIDQTWEWM